MNREDTHCDVVKI
ncbi:hypothetical protein OVA10_07990 [Lelliottia sp. SL45]|uniref:Uncharacterized protein n=1 Tax=Enterobacter vonholyi TaxID=2797505 RepID=A0ABU6E8K1_9ENTR|nr:MULTISPECIES: hypothetical protein [Enterobacteriaceae]MCB4614101.1 hypothetical protein [Enterobacter asburiae]MCD4561608.1 hypothetical protein [Lelliottia nimipressuralis]MCE9967369.1 hypothetical protein [Lelliottia amnigena]MCG5045704.1 hypothetical protein [Huaxiibacter chinensis]MCL5634545.1 hypothetical protein [Enterobacter vonholyi]MCY1697997.1 hypothetical protein [Lelliottia sp. SL45]MDA5604414.1 hypothetical protein [Enterobacter sp. PI-10]